jgi:hypothetical protein
MNFPEERSGIVGFTVCNAAGLTAVFSQLGPLCIIGVIDDESPLLWKGTRIQSLGGVFPVGKQAVPAAFGAWLHEYFRDVNRVEA